MSRLRRALTFENVLVTVVAFVVLAGGTAFAASQLGKNSVGKKQLKANSVTAKKIKKNAVTKAKIKAKSVTGAQVKNGSLQSSNLNLAEMPYSRIVHKARGGGPVAIAPTPTLFPLDSPNYVQAAGEDDFFNGFVDITFEPGCEANRHVDAEVLMDSPDPANPSQADIVAAGSVSDDGGGTVTKPLKLGFTELGGARFQPETATNHTLTLVLELECKSGSGATASNAALDVVGVR